jgi:hypothetical protein
VSAPNPTQFSLTDEQVSPLFSQFERASPYLLGFLILYSFLMGLAKAASTPFWNDEILTWTIVHQPSVSVLWRALVQGADTQPPLYYLIERLFVNFITNTHVALRLPSILAFCCTLACVFVFARKRGGAGLAAISMAILWNTILYDNYAVEARTYSLSVAAVAFAMVCYQRASSVLWTVFLGLSLALSVALHYYAIFALGSFVLAEEVYYLSARKLRIGVWLAIFAGALPLIGFWPLLSEQRRLLGQHYWAPPKLSYTLGTYGDFFQLPVSLGIGFAGLLALSLFLKGPWTEILSEKSFPGKASLLHEHALLLGMLGMPFVVFVVTRITHGGFLDRYVLWASLPMVLIPSYVLPRFRALSFLVLAVFLLAAAAREVLTLNSLRSHVGRIMSPAASVERLVSTAGNPDLPVVVGTNNDYVQLSYYASPEWAKRFVAIEDPASAVAYIGTDSSDIELPILAKYGPFNVYDFAAFAATHHEFLLYSTSESATAGPFGFYDRWVPKLLDDGYSLRVVAAEGNRRVYLVHSSAGQP